MNIKVTHIKSPLAAEFAKPMSIEEEIEFRKLLAVEELLQFIKRSNISQEDLRKKMGITRVEFTDILSCSDELTVDTLVRAARAAGAIFKVSYQKAEKL